MLLSCHQNAGQNRNIEIDNKSIKNVAQSKYVETTLTNQNLIQEEIKSRLNVSNVCYYLVQKLLSSSLLTENMKIRIYKGITMPVFLFGCEIWSLI
jgi:hypothetical protein